MYAKTNPKAGRLSPRQKRIFAITAVLVVVVFGGLTAWGVVAHDSYGGSGHGCVNVTVPNSTGGWPAWVHPRPPAPRRRSSPFAAPAAIRDRE